MARQTGSGRTGVHEILRGGLQAKCSSDASSSTTTQRCIQRRQARRATRSGAVGTRTRHCEDSRAGDQEIQELREHEGRSKKQLTHEVRSKCADDPVAHLSSAPSSRSLATPTQKSCTATLLTVSCSSENLRREWGGHRNPMSLPPCPTTIFCVFNDGYVRDELAKRIRGTGKDGGETSSQRLSTHRSCSQR